MAVPSKVRDEENVAGTLVSCINLSSCLSFCAVAPALPRTVRATPCTCSQDFFQVSPGSDYGTHTDLTFIYVIMYIRDYVHARLCTYVIMYICDYGPVLVPFELHCAPHVQINVLKNLTRDEK